MDIGKYMYQWVSIQVMRFGMKKISNYGGGFSMKCKKCTKAKSCQKCEQHLNWILKDLMNFMDQYSSEDKRPITQKEG